MAGVEFIVADYFVDPNGVQLRPVKEPEPEKPQRTGPFASLSEAAEKALLDAELTTVALAQAKGKGELVKLKNIGAATADAIMALPTG